MKEYKVINPALGLGNKSLKFEDLLNSNAREGWTVKSIVDDGHGSITYIIFEREKNR